MKVTRTAIPDVMVVEPRVFGDARGFFYESFNQQAFNEATGTNFEFVQDNHSRSSKGVLRGAVWDVAVDIRKGSPTFGQWVAETLTEDNHKQFWIPPGFAHGFVVLSDTADFLYKTTNYYAPQSDRGILWSDPNLGIQWPDLGMEFLLSEKDRKQQRLKYMLFKQIKILNIKFMQIKNF